jgi:hypothetical protein
MLGVEKRTGERKGLRLSSYPYAAEDQDGSCTRPSPRSPRHILRGEGGGRQAAEGGGIGGPKYEGSSHDVYENKPPTNLTSIMLCSWSKTKNL